jgi:hypothetical protein
VSAGWSEPISHALEQGGTNTRRTHLGLLRLLGFAVATASLVAPSPPTAATTIPTPTIAITIMPTPRHVAVVSLVVSPRVPLPLTVAAVARWLARVLPLTPFAVTPLAFAPLALPVPLASLPTRQGGDGGCEAMGRRRERASERGTIPDATLPHTGL